MSDTEAIKGNLSAPNKKPNKFVKALKAMGITLCLIIIASLMVNACLTVFKPHYYPTFGGNRLFAIITDSMEPTIPTGSMIVCRAPKDEDKDNIKKGDIITYELKDHNGQITLFTHRVEDVLTETETGQRAYVTKGDNAGGTDSVHPMFEDVVGIYYGKKCGFIGYIIGFINSTSGIITFILALFIITLAWITVWYLGRQDKRRELENAALRKSSQQLSTVSLRYDNIREITAVMDVLDMVTNPPKKRADDKVVVMRLGEFIEAENIELPQTPETAAVLDSLPAPDTPSTLAAALRNGATLRQAEDGQTLILTGMSGGKSILLTPVQTPDGIILCQQGVRLRSDIAPNIESVGATSMPEYPEFFEGQPLEKNVEYPELPQPESKKFGPSMLSSHGSQDDAAKAAQALSAPMPVGQSKLVQIGEDETEDARVARLAAVAAATVRGGDSMPPSKPRIKAPLSPEEEEKRRVAAEKRRQARLRAKERKAKQLEEERRAAAARALYLQYREAAAELELRQTAELSGLLDTHQALSPEEATRIAEYKKAQPKKERKKLSPEQLERRRAAAKKRKEEQEAFLAALTPADRELYLSEQKLSRARAATIRRLKRISADRKLLEKMD